MSDQLLQLVVGSPRLSEENAVCPRRFVRSSTQPMYLLTICLVNQRSCHFWENIIKVSYYSRCKIIQLFHVKRNNSSPPFLNRFHLISSIHS